MGSYYTLGIHNANGCSQIDGDEHRFNLKLTDEDESNFFVDAQKIFKIDTLRDELNTAIRDAQGLDPIVVGLKNGVFKSVDFMPINGELFTMSTISKSTSSAEIAAYQFTFNFRLSYNFLDGNGNVSTGSTEKAQTTFNLLDTDALKRYMIWAGQILPVELFKKKR